MDNITDDILQTMVDLCNHATDTIWITNSETMFTRLETLYLKSGGTQETLEKTFPQYCSGIIL